MAAVIVHACDYMKQSVKFYYCIVICCDSSLRLSWSDWIQVSQ